MHNACNIVFYVYVRVNLSFLGITYFSRSKRMIVTSSTEDEVIWYPVVKLINNTIMGN